MFKPLTISINDINNGIKSAFIRYRMEDVSSDVSRSIIGRNSLLYIDGAHNPAGARSVADFIISENQKKYMRTYIINGRTAETDSISFLYNFRKIVHSVIAVASKFEGLAESPYIIKKACEELSIKSDIATSIKDSLEKIMYLDKNRQEMKKISVYKDFLQNLESIPNTRDELLEMMQNEWLHRNNYDGIRVIICGSFYLARDLRYEGFDVKY
jgi:folylpolyglutamate synthase/dihydropteroate synthase